MLKRSTSCPPYDNRAIGFVSTARPFVIESYASTSRLAGPALNGTKQLFSRMQLNLFPMPLVLLTRAIQHTLAQGHASRTGSQMSIDTKKNEDGAEESWEGI